MISPTATFLFLAGSVKNVSNVRREKKITVIVGVQKKWLTELISMTLTILIIAKFQYCVRREKRKYPEVTRLEIIYKNAWRKNHFFTFTYAILW